jgi:ABC-2 type transport system permease protein
MTTTATTPAPPSTPSTPPTRSRPAKGVVDDALLAVLTRGKRPARPNALSASLTFGWRALLKIRHVPEQLFDVTAFPIMITLMFTYLFGGALAGSPGEYLQFVLPGIVVQAVVFITMYTGVAVNTDISKGVFDRFRSLPIWQPAALVGALLGDLVRYTLAATMVIVLGLVLGFRPGAGLAGIVSSLALVVVFAFCLSWIWTALGLVMRTPTAVMGVSATILFPFTFVSNIFVDPQTMPAWLTAAVGFNPITHVTTAARDLMHGTATADAVVRVLLIGAATVVIFGPLTAHLYRHKH